MRAYHMEHLDRVTLEALPRWQYRGLVAGHRLVRSTFDARLDYLHIIRAVDFEPERDVDGWYTAYVTGGEWRP